MKIIRGATTPSPSGSQPFRHSPHMHLPVPASGPGAARQQPGEEARRAGSSPSSPAPERPHPAGTQPERPGTPPGARTPPAVSAEGLRADSPLPDTPQSLLRCGAELTVGAARCPEPGGCLGHSARLRILSRSRSSVSASHRAPASPLGRPPRAAAPHWLRQPGHSPSRLRPPEAPPLHPFPPHRPSQFLASPRRESCFDSALTLLRQTSEVIGLHPKRV